MVRDLLPRAPARLSKKINIGDQILAVDGQPASATSVLTLLKGNDQGVNEIIVCLSKMRSCVSHATDRASIRMPTCSCHTHSWKQVHS